MTKEELSVWEEEPAPARPHISAEDLEKQKKEKEERIERNKQLARWKQQEIDEEIALREEEKRLQKEKAEQEKQRKRDEKQNQTLLEKICAACKEESEFIERDHRIPRSMGGTNERKNIQYLCRSCHIRKSVIERLVWNFTCETKTVEEWFYLTFQNNQEKIQEFLGILRSRVAHFSDVVNSV